MSGKLGPYELNSIITGDARELSKAIPDESVDLVLTDPPWGIGFKYPNGYDDSPENYFSLLRWAIEESNRILKPGSYAFIYQSSKRIKETWPLFPDDSRLFAGCKNFNQCGANDVDYSVDPIVFWKKPGEFKAAGIFRDWHVANTANTSNGSRGHGLIRYSPRRPFDTILFIMENMSCLGDTVVDFFLGTGTVAEAAKKLQRNYLAFEIDPDTAALARQRVAQTQPPLPFYEPQQLELTEELCR